MDNSNRVIKFRAWDKKNKEYIQELHSIDFTKKIIRGGFSIVGCMEYPLERIILEQYTGLKDKNGLQEVYEGDIIDATGNIITNIHEKTHTEKSDFIIQGFGTKDWIATYQGAVARGCKDSE